MAYIDLKEVDKVYPMGEMKLKALDYQTGKQVLEVIL